MKYIDVWMGATPNLHYSHLHDSILHNFQILQAPRFTPTLIYTTPDLHGTHLHKPSPPNLHTPILHEIYTAPNLHIFPKCVLQSVFYKVYFCRCFFTKYILNQCDLGKLSYKTNNLKKQTSSTQGGGATPAY